MEGYDVISDSYSAEVISLMILERMWSKVSKYLDNKSTKKNDIKLEQRLADMEKKIAVNTALDKERNK